MACAHIELHGEIRRPPSLPFDPLVPLYDDAFLASLPFDQLLTHTCMCRDAINEIWRVHDPRYINQVHIYMKLLTLIIKLCIIIYIKISSSYWIL